MLDFIVNPTAGGKHGKKTESTVSILKTLLDEKGVLYRFHFTEKKGDGTEITKALIKDGATDIIVVGGDGTLHEIINGFSSFDKVNMGLIPCGTGNDFAFALSIPQDVKKALDIILNGEPKYTDYMQMPSVRGINVIGTGIDVDVLNRYSKLKRKNKFGYTRCLVSALCHYKCPTFTVTINGKTLTQNSFVMAVANGSCFGGGIPMCPVADPTDKSLNFVSVKGMNKIKIIGAFLKLKSGKILTLKETFHEKMDEIKIDLPEGTVINVDGELYSDIPFEIKIVSNQLKFYR